ncbi:hypothetical protein [Photobacterium leiognathi]|uniref:hypothetical protein n=1 Tax=Photobacterium leiognathi TaxID=553611 RepID=UPI002980BC64|nr:hypothetical protein [Photobacterium leiognathi]
MIKRSFTNVTAIIPQKLDLKTKRKLIDIIDVAIAQYSFLIKPNTNISYSEFAELIKQNYNTDQSKHICHVLNQC